MTGKHEDDARRFIDLAASPTIDRLVTYTEEVSEFFIASKTVVRTGRIEQINDCLRIGHRKSLNLNDSHGAHLTFKYTMSILRNRRQIKRQSTGV